MPVLDRLKNQPRLKDSKKKEQQNTAYDPRFAILGYEEGGLISVYVCVFCIVLIIRTSEI